MKLLILALMGLSAVSMYAADAFVGSLDLRKVSTPLKQAEDTFAIKTQRFANDFRTLLSDSSLSWHSDSGASKHTAMGSFLGRYKAILASLDGVASTVSNTYRAMPKVKKEFASDQLADNVLRCTTSHNSMLKNLKSTLQSFKDQRDREIAKIAEPDAVLLRTTKKVWAHRIQFISKFITTIEKMFNVEKKRLHSLIDQLA